MFQRSGLTIAAAAAALLLAGMTFGASLWLLAAYSGLLTLAVCFWLSSHWDRSAVAIRHQLPEGLEINESFEVLVDITNRSRLPIGWVLAEDLLPRSATHLRPPGLEVLGPRLAVFFLGSGQTHQLRYQVTCRRRGYYQIGPTVLETGDWMGLTRRFRVVAPPQAVLVYPRQIPLAGYEIGSPRPIGEIRIREMTLRDPTRIRGIRKWEVGDPLRSVHWAATARTGTLHSKVYEPSSIAGATVVLDLHKLTNPLHHEPVRSDLAVSLACSIAAALYELQQPFGFLSNGRDAADRIRLTGLESSFQNRGEAWSGASMRDSDDRLHAVSVPAGRGPAHFEEVRRTLARVELSDGLPIRDTILENQQRMARNTTLIVILPNCDPQTASLLIDMRRRGWVISTVINTADMNVYLDSAGPLIEAGIDTIQLTDEATLPMATRRVSTRGSNS